MPILFLRQRRHRHSIEFEVHDKIFCSLSIYPMQTCIYRVFQQKRQNCWNWKVHGLPLPVEQWVGEGHLPSNLVFQFQQFRKGVSFWDTLFPATSVLCTKYKMKTSTTWRRGRESNECKSVVDHDSVCSDCVPGRGVLLLPSASSNWDKTILNKLLLFHLIHLSTKINATLICVGCFANFPRDQV